MNLLLSMAQIYLPTFIKKKKLHELIVLTADGFQSDMPKIKNLSYDDCLKNDSSCKCFHYLNYPIEISRFSPGRCRLQIFFFSPGLLK